MVQPNGTPVKLIWALPGSEERILGLTWPFVKGSRSPSAGGAWTGEPFTFYERPCPTPECVPPKPSITQISYTGVTFWLDHVESERVTIDYLNSRRSIPIF